jgi:hypothetical protein
VSDVATLQKAEFEKRFLSLVYQTNTLITAPNIAYHLKISIDEAQDHLLDLELNGTIQQQTDEEGNSFYLMPNRPTAGTLPAQIADGEDGPDAQPGGGPPGITNPADIRSAPIYSNPPAKAKNVNGLVLNVIFPGVGSLVCGRMVGLAMLGMVLLGLIMFFLPIGFGRLAGVLPIIAGWIWSIIAGVKLMSEQDSGHRPPR